MARPNSVEVPDYRGYYPLPPKKKVIRKDCREEAPHERRCLLDMTTCARSLYSHHCAAAVVLLGRIRVVTSVNLERVSLVQHVAEVLISNVPFPIVMAPSSPWVPCP
jgi:hypothetical protein